MPSIIDKMSLAELRRHHEEVAALIHTREAEQKASVLEKLKALAAESGFALEDLVGMPAARPAPSKKHSGDKRSVVAPKYRDPATGTTWTGRGKKPKWVEAALTAGKTLEDLAI